MVIAVYIINVTLDNHITFPLLHRTLCLFLMTIHYLMYHLMGFCLYQANNITHPLAFDGAAANLSPKLRQQY